MAIQLQAFSVHALISQLYILQLINKKHSFTSYPAAKHYNTANLDLQTYKKTSELFLWYRTGMDFRFSNNFASFLCKSFHSCRIYNSLYRWDRFSKHGWIDKKYYIPLTEQSGFIKNYYVCYNGMAKHCFMLAEAIHNIECLWLHTKQTHHMSVEIDFTVTWHWL